jgi:hypothetical protein
LFTQINNLSRLLPHVTGSRVRCCKSPTGTAAPLMIRIEDKTTRDGIKLIWDILQTSRLFNHESCILVSHF